MWYWTYIFVSTCYKLTNMYIFVVKEISPDKQRGAFLTFHHIGVSLGILLAFLIPYTFPLKTSGHIGWVGLYISGGPIFFFLIQLICQAIWFKYDTPKYYILSNQRDKVNSFRQIIGKIMLEGYISF